MGHEFHVYLEIEDGKITRYQYEFYPNFRDSAGNDQNEIGYRLLKELPIPGNWLLSAHSDCRDGVLFKWMGGINKDLSDFDFQEIIKELNKCANEAQKVITGAIQIAVIAKIAMKKS